MIEDSLKNVKGIAFEASDDNTWDVYLERKSGDVIINTSFPNIKNVCKSVKEVAELFENNKYFSNHIFEKVANFLAWHFLQKSIEEGNTPKLDNDQMYTESHRLKCKILASISEEIA